MKEQYVIRKYFTPDDGELVQSEDEREIVLSQYELGVIVTALERVNETNKVLCGVNLDILIGKICKLELVNL